jgi:hypothetical protein
MDISLSPQAGQILRKAQEHQKKQKDSFISIDHVILALMDDAASWKVFTDHGVTKTAFENAISQTRGNRRVESKTAEAGYEALSKYAIDMVALAEQDKLDPVIGRDDEIRRVIRVLSRRTKNNPVLIGYVISARKRNGTRHDFSKRTTNHRYYTLIPLLSIVSLVWERPLLSRDLLSALSARMSPSACSAVSSLSTWVH